MLMAYHTVSFLFYQVPTKIRENLCLDAGVTVCRLGNFAPVHAGLNVRTATRIYLSVAEYSKSILF